VTLGISESTVNWHIANAFERLGASSRAEAVALAIRSNGADRAPLPEPVAPALARPAATAAPVSWPRLLAIAIAIALAGALLGGATVATLQLGTEPAATAPPANGGDRPPTASPASGTDDEDFSGETAPVGSSPEVDADPTRAPLLQSPAILTPLPAVSVPPIPSVPVPLPTAAPLPTLPVTPPPLPIPSALPMPIPTLPVP
jgi:hypothetical protein